MDVYELANSFVRDPNLHTAGDRLIQFSDAAMQEKNRNRPLDSLYRSVLSFFSLFTWPSITAKDESGYYDFASGHHASGVYLAMLLSSIRTSPVKTLKAIKELGAELNEAYCEPVGKGISEEDVKSVLGYLDSEFGVQKAIFSNGNDTILLLPCSHRQYNSQCLALQNPATGELRVALLMYHMSYAGVRNNIDPRFVFCHELGHALHARYINNATMDVPDELLHSLEALFPLIRSLDKETQGNILADVLAMGMLYKSPFEDADPYPQITTKDKAAFQEILRVVCKGVLEGERALLLERQR